MLCVSETGFIVPLFSLPVKSVKLEVERNVQVWQLASYQWLCMCLPP